MSLFDERPEPDHDWSNGIYRRSYYRVEWMDAWLEKVQSELEKLTAIKAYFTMLMDSTEVYPNWMKEVGDIAEYVLEIVGREGFRLCANCGVYTDNFCIIEKGPPEENWIEDVWVKMGMLGKPICGECYYQ